MKKALFLIPIVLVMAFIVVLGACSANKADKELEEIDKFITKYDTSESMTSEDFEAYKVITSETETTVLVEAKTEEETNDGWGSNSDNPADTGNNDDTGSVDIHSDIDSRSAEELAEEVINKGLNGADREEFLGDRYDEVQRLIDEKYSIEMPTYVYDDTTYVYQPDTGVYYGDGALNPEDGVNYYGGVLETYYDLDMSWCIGVMRDMGYDEVNYPYWIRSDGVKMLGDYVMCAADFSYEPRGTITSTSLGTAIVVDTGLGGWGWHDICVSGW